MQEVPSPQPKSRITFRHHLEKKSSPFRHSIFCYRSYKHTVQQYRVSHSSVYGERELNSVSFSSVSRADAPHNVDCATTGSPRRATRTIAPAKHLPCGFLSCWSYRSVAPWSQGNTGVVSGE